MLACAVRESLTTWGLLGKALRRGTHLGFWLKLQLNPGFPQPSPAMPASARTKS